MYGCTEPPWIGPGRITRPRRPGRRTCAVAAGATEPRQRLDQYVWTLVLAKPAAEGQPGSPQIGQRRGIEPFHSRPSLMHPTRIQAQGCGEGPRRRAVREERGQPPRSGLCRRAVIAVRPAHRVVLTGHQRRTDALQRRGAHQAPNMWAWTRSAPTSRGAANRRKHRLASTAAAGARRGKMPRSPRRSGRPRQCPPRWRPRPTAARNRPRSRPGPATAATRTAERHPVRARR
jgi:hypothetical protein